MLKSSGRRIDISASPSSTRCSPRGTGCTWCSRASAAASRRSTSASSWCARAGWSDLVELGSLSQQAATFLDASIRAGLNVLVAGGTQAGKTTFLNCLAAAIPGGDRVISAEEVFELQLQPPGLGAHADPSGGARGHRRDRAARPGQGGAADAAEPGDRGGGAGRGVPRPAARAQRRAARHVHPARQQRPRGAGQDVHPAAAGGGEHLGPLRRADRGQLRRPGRAPGHRRARRTPRQRDRLRPRPGGERHHRDRAALRAQSTASCVGRAGTPTRLERFQRIGIDVHQILAGGR